MRATPRTPRSCDGPRGSHSMRPLGLAGQRSLLQARLARCLCRSHRSPSDRRTTGVSPHHTMTCTDVGGRATDGAGAKGTFFYMIEEDSLAGSSVAIEWSDHARTVTLQPLPGWCGCVYKPAGRFWPLRMAKRVGVSRERREEAKEVDRSAWWFDFSRSISETRKVQSCYVARRKQSKVLKRRAEKKKHHPYDPLSPTDP